MKKLSPTFVLMLLVGVCALSYGKSKPMADKQMDRISAGSAIADGESTATNTNSSAVVLAGSAQSGASSINIVDAANSTVANGANTWSGDSLHDADVEQANAMRQTGVPCDCSGPGSVRAATRSTTSAEVELEIDVATADAIALDGSTATNASLETVSLSGSAQANAKALNIVNAVGSIVGNGVNVASSTNLNNISLTQTNIIVQSAH